MTPPVLDATASPALPGVFAGAIDLAGISVASLLVDGSISDVDGVVQAIAVEAVNTSLGTWQHSLDNGATWLTILSDLVNSSTNQLCLLLGPTALVRLLPFGNLTGDLPDAITFRAWDMGSGSSGQYVDVGAGDPALSSA